MKMRVIKSREVLLCVHDQSVCSCEICQAEIANGHEVNVRLVTVELELAQIQLIPEEEE